jgi:hypothetical protein
MEHKQLRMILIMSVVLAILLLCGCSTNWKVVYSKEYKEVTPNAMSSCQNYGQKYMQHYLNGTDWSVICYQDSPYRTVIKKVITDELLNQG